ncbi:MAG: DUF2970 domain-containing protein [Halieaceae bacterium]|jgi:hypothetical protein|nr:DUF2970 domain-containing protein [Halieaceae bacterium]
MNVPESGSAQDDDDASNHASDKDDANDKQDSGNETPEETPAGTGNAQDPGSAGTEARRPLNPLQVVGSVLAAGLGVQSSRNRERDFQQGRAPVFIAAGLIFTALFIGGVYTVVSMVLAGR